MRGCVPLFASNPCARVSRAHDFPATLLPRALVHAGMKLEAGKGVLEAGGDISDSGRRRGKGGADRSTVRSVLGSLVRCAVRESHPGRNILQRLHASEPVGGLARLRLKQHKYPGTVGKSAGRDLCRRTGHGPAGAAVVGGSTLFLEQRAAREWGVPALDLLDDRAPGMFSGQ